MFAALAAQRAEGAGFALVALFVSPEGDPQAIAAAAAQAFPEAVVIGATTAGEISSEGYTEQEIVALGLSDRHFAARAGLIRDLANLEAATASRAAVAVRAELARMCPQWEREFAWLIADGLARREDLLLSGLRLGLGAVPLFGGSAGDGLDFRRTVVIAEGAAHENAAVVAVLRTRCPIRVFKLDHFTPTEAKMVVTEADPERRAVREINAERADLEYARLVGCAPEQLSAAVFASHPVVVMVGGHHHVRAIQRVEPNGEITFLSAIDEGLVLTLAEPTDIGRHLEATLGALSRPIRPEAIIGCDCILRRVEVEQAQRSREISGILARHRVVGFNTYGEQFHSVHVNQTLTGVAIYPPEEGA